MGENMTKQRATSSEGQMIMVKASDGSGEFAAYLSQPASGAGPGLVIAQEIFGVNANLREIADHYAEAGYIVLVPDLFWRQQPGVQLGYTPEDWQRAFQFFKGFDQDLGVDDLQATIDLLRARPGCTGEVGVMGFCLGGKLPTTVSVSKTRWMRQRTSSADWWFTSPDWISTARPRRNKKLSRVSLNTKV
jgi:carboxymethylenebutenolidase